MSLKSFSRRIFWCFFLLNLKIIFGALMFSLTERTLLIQNTSKIICSFHAKIFHIYVDSHIAFGVPSFILKELDACGTSYISMRSRGQSSPLPAIKDDGIRMYLLMVLQKPSQFVEVSIIQKKSAAKHLSHVVIVIEHSKDITESWLCETFKKFWNKWFQNVVIMFSRDEQLQIYRYNPFAENILIKVTPKRALPTVRELFPKKLPNMEGKPLRICLYNDNLRAIFHSDGRVTGSDGLMAGFIAQRLNATRFLHRVSTYGFENKTADLCFKEVAMAMDDVALNIRFFALPVFRKHVEHTIVHSRDDLCVLVPKAEIASTFWNLFRAYSAIVWGCIFFSLLVAYSFLNFALFRTCHIRKGLLLQLFASSLTLPFRHPPKKLSLRIFIFCWLFYGLLICGAFKGTLTSNLFFRTFLPDINTLHDLAFSKYKLALVPRHTKHLNRFLNSSDPIEARIKQKMMVISDGQLMQSIASNNLSYAYLQKRHVARFQAFSRKHFRKGRPLYHVMENCLVPFHAVFIVPYGSPHLGAINNLVRSSHEFGFVSYWERLMNAAFKKSFGKTSILKGRSDGDPVVLKLPHFQAAFCLWAMGLLVASVVFLWENFGKIFLRRSCKTRRDIGAWIFRFKARLLLETSERKQRKQLKRQGAYKKATKALK